MVEPASAPPTTDYTMSWLQTEYILKGIYLGLLAFVALQEPDWPATGRVALFTLGGLVLFVGAAGLRKLREGYRVRGRPFAFLAFLLLENPAMVYAGVLLGMAAGAYTVRNPEHEEWELAAAVGGGAVLGIVFCLLRHVRHRYARLGLCLALAAALVGGAVAWLEWHPPGDEQGQHIGVLLLLGIPLFYLLTFAGLAEESEVEVGAMCAALGLGLWLLRDQLPPNGKPLVLALPILLYLVYTLRVLPGLRVFKHVVRGLSYARVGRHKLALLCLNRAVQLNPANRMAQDGLWRVHRTMDWTQIASDPEALRLVNFDLYLERVATLLMQGPRPEQLQEAHQLLDLVSGKRPDMRPRCDYWRAVAHTHARQYDEAAAALGRVLDTAAADPADAQRRAVLFQAWQLALTLHNELTRRVGNPQLALPGRRLEAIGAVERRLAANADDADAWNLKRVLYSGLTEAEYDAAAADGRPAADFDHAYAHQLGLALINDAARWQRGVEYLRVAARGLPAVGPTIFIQIAKAYDRAGNPQGAWDNYELSKRAGRAAGPKNLTEEDRHAYFAVLKMLAEYAVQRGDLDAATEDYLLFTEYERSGLETYRSLAELFERKGDVWAALKATEQGLIYNARDADLLARKDKIYYSVMPDDVRDRLESVGKIFDAAYCRHKARSLLDMKSSDLDLLDWAQHLAELAQAAEPAGLTARTLRAWCLLRRGEKDQAVALFEEVRAAKPEKFPSGEEEEAWYLTCRLLGDLYLYDLHRPELAVSCYQDYRKSSKSGADTVYKLGQAYEEIGDRARAKRCYEQVVAFDSHPRAPDAHDALQRLQAN
jgi:predicted Zn-dependent protease